jgi:hypothetical protein
VEKVVDLPSRIDNKETSTGRQTVNRKFRITYDIVTPESAEEGDTAENGFVAPGGWQDPVESIEGPATDEVYGWTLQEAELFLGRGGMEDVGNWFASADGSVNFQTGAETRYALHPPENITAASYERLARIFC